MTDTLIHDQVTVPAPTVDFGVAADDYARHRQGHPEQTFARLATLGVGRPGQDLLDVGTGTGAAARVFAAAGARVTAIDPSPALLAEGQRLARAAGLAITWHHGRAEALALASASVDVVTVAQAWHWFDRDQAAAEARRVLRPGGALALFYSDWLALPASPVEVTLAVVARHRSAPMPAPTLLGHHGVYPEFVDDLTAAGFRELELFGFDFERTYTHAGWLGRMRASAAVATMTAAAQRGFADELTAELAARYPDPMVVPHRGFGLVGRSPGARS